MADLNISRKPGPTLWPWLIGLVVLGLLIWAIAELVNTDRDNETMAEADSSDGAVATAVAPGAAPAPAAAQPSGDVAPAPLAALMPLGPQDVGQRVAVSGDVVTDPDAGGFWVRTENRAVIWVKSSQRVKAGQQVQDLPGIIQQARPGEPGAAPDADVEAEAGKGVAFAPGLYLDASPVQAAGTPARRSAGQSGTEARARPGRARRAGAAG